MVDIPIETLGLLVTACVMFVTGGVVKGTLGVGLPLVVVPLLSLLLDSSQAMGLLVMPVLVSNALQSVEGGRLIFALKRFGTLMGAQFIATLWANDWGSRLSPREMNAVIAFTVVSAVAVMLFSPRGDIPKKTELWLGPVVGAIAGAMGGASSLTGPILITYLMALRLDRDDFVGSISIIYLLGSIPMYAAMLIWGRFGLDDVAWSCAGLAPMYLGLRLGATLRKRLSEEGFRRILMGFLIFLAILLVLK
jgi:uncharacterized membrane protein YfcA